MQPLTLQSSSLKLLDQLKPKLVGMFIEWFSTFFFFLLWIRNPPQEQKTPRCHKRMFSVFYFDEACSIQTDLTRFL
jgi:hypothetical protein